MCGVLLLLLTHSSQRAKLHIVMVSYIITELIQGVRRLGMAGRGMDWLLGRDKDGVT